MIRSDVLAKALPSEKLPAYQPHTAAKHRLLRRYLNAWLPILGFKYSDVVLIDGFASSGRYRSGEPGSPLIMLEAYLGREDRTRLGSAHYFFIEKHKGFVQHLTSELEQVEKVNDVEVDIKRGEYSDRFREVVDEVRALGAPPTFAFVDPYGYRDNPLNRIIELKRLVPKSEALVYLPATHMARFEATGITASALDTAFGGDSWRTASDETTRRAKSEALKDVFYEQMKQHFEWVTAFRVEPQGGNAYYLMFGTGHRKGLQKMKEAMWSVDEQGGRDYRYVPPTPAEAAGQVQLDGFEDPEPAREDHGLELRRLLQAHFQDQVFTVAEAADFTLTRTRYLDSKHLKRATLARAEREGLLEPLPTSPRRSGSFSNDAMQMRFRVHAPA